ncbi:hypothetical protein KAFR_0C03250 [Kazachstania africana CBS 2517]|uniref:Ran-specific GTPase-activating protein 30 n=1 Tax=Kazachstania africana (strain ATCC 22294 / BCRC 22015 / CBS 2517 / CECT 1963 / NBRC 1671 / NRRL Y-8276) TaxID=1071382 RepID=H2ASG7_KAZAF|nr:hypothetical protein KAFR_0C03250 [Kazachstania africana CBS 2517]CCF57317.1 hypothetical protein KAFR_0C03250 [Kazachstania africana CBS 2517]
MDELLSKAGSQVVTFAIKSGISIASSYALKQISNFAIQIPKDDAGRIEELRAKLENRIEIVSSAIDLVRLVAARGNTNLTSTLKLTRDLKNDIDKFDENINLLLEKLHDDTIRSSQKRTNLIKSVEDYIKDLLGRIDEATPFINLSLTTSGATLSTTLPKSVSTSILLQASYFINKNNELFDSGEVSTLRVGPKFEVTLYSVFYNSLNSENRVVWKEDMARASVSLSRVKEGKMKYRYIMDIEQNFDDGRYHNTDGAEEVPEKLNIRLSQIERVFFSVSGKLLKLEEKDSSVLVLKVADRDNTGGLTDNEELSDEKHKWYAFGEYGGPVGDSDSSEEEEDSDDVDKKSKEDYDDRKYRDKDAESELANNNEISTSIALLEYIIRLSSLQGNDQEGLLEVNDERLSVYLNDENPSAIKHKSSISHITSTLANVRIE